MSSDEDPSELAETLLRLERLYEALSRKQQMQQQVVDLSMELKPHMRRLFSGDMLWSEQGNVGDASGLAEVTLEVEGDGEDITSLFVLVEMEPISPPATTAANAEPAAQRDDSDGAAVAVPVAQPEAAPEREAVPVAAAAAPPRCHACETLITQGKVISAGGERSFHADCFVCTTCDEPLLEGQYAEHTDGEMYCQEHYAELVGAATVVCGHCGEPIAGQGLSAVGNTFHDACFAEAYVCLACARPLQNGFVSVKGGLYCPEHNPEAPACAGCGQPLLTRQVISALDRKWHPGCFVCEECKKPFDGGLFFKVDGKPFCSDHALDVDEDDGEYSDDSGESAHSDE